MPSILRDTYRYVRVRRLDEERRPTGGMYTYRCDFYVSLGDRVFVTMAGELTEVMVVGSSAKDSFKHPEAPYVLSYTHAGALEWSWPHAYDVRLKERPWEVLTKSRTVTLKAKDAHHWTDRHGVHSLAPKGRWSGHSFSNSPTDTVDQVADYSAIEARCVKQMWKDQEAAYRYVRVKWLDPQVGDKDVEDLITFRSSFLVNRGDIVSAPYGNGYRKAQVHESTALRDFGEPDAPWLKGFIYGRETEAWPAHYHVRVKDQPGIMLYDGQTLATNAPVGAAAYGTPTIDSCGWIRRNMEAYQKRMAYAVMYGMSPTPLIKDEEYDMEPTIEDLEERRKGLTEELEELDARLERMRAQERLDEIETRLTRHQEAEEYRDRYRGQDKELVEEAIELRQLIKYGRDEDEGKEE